MIEIAAAFLADEVDLAVGPMVMPSTVMAARSMPLLVGGAVSVSVP